MMANRTGKIGFYGSKTRAMQRRLTFELFGLTYKTANVYLYLGSRYAPKGSDEPHEPHITDIYTKVFHEVPDRAYRKEPIEVPIGANDFSESSMDFSRFGILNPMTSEHTFKIHMDDYKELGRRLVAGDVFEVPFFSQTDNESSFWEITDVDNKREPEDFMNSFTAVPLSDSRKTRDIPIDNSNSDILTDIMSGFDDQVEDDVRTDEPTYDDPNDIKEIDYRRKEQKRFLDEYD